MSERYVVIVPQHDRDGQTLFLQVPKCMWTVNYQITYSKNNAFDAPKDAHLPTYLLTYL